MPHTILVALPGPNWHIHAAVTALRAGTRRHAQIDMPSAQSIGNFNLCWLTALNFAEHGQATHIGMLHSDVIPFGWPSTPEAPAGFFDVMIDEMEAKNCLLCSAAIPVKEDTGRFSCGILDPDTSWSTWKRFTARELQTMPLTFTAADLGQEARGLQHNNGLWIADLRDHERWTKTNAAGELLAIFDFKTRARRKNGVWFLDVESEDIYFSRMIHDLGIPSCITRAVPQQHLGSWAWTSEGEWGRWEVDEDNRHKWDGKNNIRQQLRDTAERVLRDNGGTPGVDYADPRAD